MLEPVDEETLESDALQDLIVVEVYLVDHVQTLDLRK